MDNVSKAGYSIPLSEELERELQEGITGIGGGAFLVTDEMWHKVHDPIIERFRRLFWEETDGL